MSQHADRSHHHATDQVLHAASAAGDVMRDALLSIVAEPKHEHWEEVLADYDRHHPESDAEPPRR